jgi:hypothetical protein
MAILSQRRKTLGSLCYSVRLPAFSHIHVYAIRDSKAWDKRVCELQQHDRFVNHKLYAGRSSLNDCVWKQRRLQMEFAMFVRGSRSGGHSGRQAVCCWFHICMQVEIWFQGRAIAAQWDTLLRLLTAVPVTVDLTRLWGCVLFHKEVNWHIKLSLPASAYNALNCSTMWYFSCVLAATEFYFSVLRRIVPASHL